MMKKYILYTTIIGLLFTACNPNKDIYDAIKSDEKPYAEEFDLELTSADYTDIKKLALVYAQNYEDTLIANDLDNYKSFSGLRSAADLIPAFLADKFIALDSASAIKVKYKYSVNDYDSIHSKALVSADYIDMFGIADTCFSSVVEPSDYLLTISTDSNYVFYITCKYGDSFAEAVDTSIAYTYIDGTWQTPNNFYILTDADYESMGRPGSYHNFSSYDEPENYLPDFLMNNYPYGISVNTAVIFYQYHSGSTVTMMDAYRYNETGWVNTTDKISPFIHSGTEWVFDPTIKYTMTLAEDYQIVVDYVTNNPDIPDGYLDSSHPETNEYYYGASSFYKNFNIKLSYRRPYDPLGLLTGLSDDEANVVLLDRINEAVGIFLQGKYPEAEPVINGVQVNYAITYDSYGENGVRIKYTVTYKCIDIGQFEYVSGPEVFE